MNIGFSVIKPHLLPVSQCESGNKAFKLIRKLFNFNYM